MNDTITFRSVTPLFNFQMDDGQEFRYHGDVNGASFEVTLKKYPAGPESFAELVKYADVKRQKSLEQIHLSPNGLIKPADYFLVADVTHPAKGLEVHANTKESVEVAQAVLDSLRLNTTKGIIRFKTYLWRSVPDTFHGSSSPSVTQSPFSNHLGLGPSVLQPSAYERCRETAAVLMQPWDDTITLERVLQMAMSYHDVTFTFLEPKHSFLLLMIIFEALFKGPEEDTPIAVSRLSQLLAQDRTERRLIDRRFRNGASSYTKIRDSIAHGDVSLESAAVKECYPGLYNYVTKAITQLLLMRNGVFDPNQDYYDEISRISKGRFANL